MQPLVVMGRPGLTTALARTIVDVDEGTLAGAVHLRGEAWGWLLQQSASRSRLFLLWWTITSTLPRLHEDWAYRGHMLVPVR
jgi:hypothetical protein